MLRRVLHLVAFSQKYVCVFLGPFGEVENSDDLWLTTPGDVSASHYKGKSLTEILGAERAKWWHRTFRKLVTKRVLDSKGKMASRPAVALGKCGDLLREIGEVEEGAMSDAAFADLLALSHHFSRGVDECKALTAEENLRQNI